MKNCCLFVCLLLSIGCTPLPRQAHVTYITVPPGGEIFSREKSFGYAPVTLYYNISNDDRMRNYKQIDAINAAWVSGAKTNRLAHRVIDINPMGNNPAYKIAIRRPVGAPNIEVDVQFALEQERNKILAIEERNKRLAIEERNKRLDAVNRSSRGSFEDDFIEAVFGYKGNSRTSEIIHEEALRESLRGRTSTKCRSKRIYNGDYETVCE
ncbi:MAG: hypothetical protein QNK31_07850 [Porticoccus sp.]|nr:hypothetical protein [Porticoccus sp.]